MTTTDPTGAALYRAILADPDDDTPRLVYADWLQEEGDDDRAEFIRVQCRIAGIQSDEDCGQPGCAECDERRPLLARELDLLASNRERWLRVECPRCGGGGYNAHSGDPYTRPSRCYHCHGTGDLGGLAPWAGPSVGTTAYPYLTVFRRGFPDEVQGCRLADVMVWRQDRCEDGSHYPSPRSGWRPHRPCKTCEGSGAVTGWKPTPWIARVFAHHPVRRVPLVDRVPWVWLGEACWYRAGSTEATGAHQQSDLPDKVFRAMRGFTNDDARQHNPDNIRWYPTADAATDALAVAVATAARAHLAFAPRP